MIVLFLLIAFALRVFRLGAQSLWADEGYGVYLASESLSNLSRDMLVDLNHVPVYFFTVHFWIQVAGNSEFSVRYLSLAAGVLTVALTYRLGLNLFGSKAVALTAAGISTVAPFQVYYSQEARMHIWTAAICLVAANAVVLALNRPGGWKNWALFALFGTLGLYTFYYAGFVVAALSIAAAAALLARRDWHGFGRLVAANAAIALVFAPWVAMAASRLYQQAEHKSKDFVAYDFVSYFHLIWKTFLGGVTVEPDKLPWPIWPAALALVLGFVALARSRYRLLLPLYLLLPALSVFFINIRFPHFQPRYMLLCTPPFYLLLAAGLALPFLWRKRLARLASIPAGMALLVLVATAAQSLANNYFDPAYFRDDYRGVAQTIREGAQPDDIVVLDAPWQIYNFPYYYQGPLKIEGLPYEDPLDPAITRPKLDKILSENAGIWLVLYGNASMDPTSFVEQYLDEHAYKVDDGWFGTIRLARYINPVPAGFSATAITSASRQFEGGMNLLGYQLAGGPPRSGDPLAIRLFWQVQQVPGDVFQVSLRLEDANGHVWAQTDGPPLEGALPTNQWRPGTVYRDPRLLRLPAGLPPGTYHFQVVVYSERGEADMSGQPAIGSVEIAPDIQLNRPDPPIQRPLKPGATYNVRLIGADLAETPYQPGQTVDIALLVRGVRPEPETVRLVLTGKHTEEHDGKAIQIPPLRTGELRQIPLSLLLHGSLADGSYDLWVEGAQGRVSLGQIEIKGRQRVFTLPPGGTKLDIPAGDGIEVASATLPRQLKGKTPVRIVWRATAEPKDNYVAFLHLVDGGGNIVAQVDEVPGGLPTAGWASGEFVIDDRTLTLDALPSGTYRFYTGLYSPDTGRRIGTGDGRILLGSVTVP